MIIPNGYCAVFALFTTVTGHACQNVVGYATSSTLTQANADDISAAIATEYKAQLNGGSTYDGVRILQGQSAGDPLQLFSTTNAGVGGRGLALTPPQVMGLLTKTTALSGRRNRGRIFIPDMAESQVGDNGAIDSTASGLLQNITTAWETDVPGAVAAIDDMVVLHGDSTTPTVVTSFDVASKVATLRRRYER